MKDTISEIEERIRSAGALKEESRAELLDLLGQLKSQIGALSKTNQEQAQSIAGFAEVSAHEATREEKNPKSLKHSILGCNPRCMIWNSPIRNWWGWWTASPSCWRTWGFEGMDRVEIFL